LVATLKLFRRFDDDDITALYLAAWWIALDDLAASGPVVGGQSFSGFVAAFDESRLSGTTSSRLSDLTGIPRETARRKLEKACTLRIITRTDGSEFRLRTLSTDIVPMFDHCVALADSILGALNRTRVRDGRDLPVGHWVVLMRSYVLVMLNFWSVRRAITRGASAVSVQVAIEILTSLKIYRRLAETGRLLRADLPMVLELAPACGTTPYFIAQIATIAHLDVTKVRRMCRNLAEHKLLKFVSRDIINPTPHLSTFPGQLLEGVFSAELRDAGFRFVKTATMILTETSVRGQPGTLHA
jgi:hypothetical protein